MSLKLSRVLLAVAAFLIAIATALGAVASHLLEGSLDARALRSFGTAVDFQFLHALGLMALAICGERLRASRWFAPTVLAILIGLVLFCGGVYASSLGGPRWLGSLAPAGGIALIAGWLAAAAVLLRSYGANAARDD